MRAKFLKSLLMAMSLLATLPVNAYDFMVDGLCYNRNSDGTSVTVTYKRSSTPTYSSLSTRVTIPKTVTYNGATYSVTAIGESAFEGCSGLTSVTIPNSVTSISRDAFNGCSGLMSVTIPNSVTVISQYTFYDCAGLTSVNIPNSVTAIGRGAFLYCDGLTSVIIGNSVTAIGLDAFSRCSNLRSIMVAQGNPKYDSRNNCNAIIETSSNTLITGCNNTIIPNSVTAIGEDAFFGCIGLTSVTIPNSVTAIGEAAFSGCIGLTSVTIPNSVTDIGYAAFVGCSGLKSIVVDNGNTKYDSRGNCSAIIETETNVLHTGCKSTIIPNSVTAIGDRAFKGCTGLTSVTIPNSVTAIDRYAFMGCSGLRVIQSRIATPEKIFYGLGIFYDIDKKDCKLIVPAGTLEKYKATSPWKEFPHIE